MSPADGKSESGTQRTCTLTITGRDGRQDVKFAIEFDPPIDSKVDQRSGFAIASSQLVKWLEGYVRGIEDED